MSRWTARKLEANASRHKAMSHSRLIGKEEQVEAEIYQPTCPCIIGRGAIFGGERYGPRAERMLIILKCKRKNSMPPAPPDRDLPDRRGAPSAWSGRPRRGSYH